MGVIRNPQEYDSKVPTNIRLVDVLKTKAIAEAEKRNITLAQVVNEALAIRYNVNIEGEQKHEHSDTQSRMG